MSPETERMIRDSWLQIEPRVERFSELFYARLFELDPEARRLFAGRALDAQQRKFVEMLNEVIVMLDDPRRLVSGLAEAGRRHLDYGVRDRDYESVGTALLDAIAQSLGAGFTAELREAWRETYSLLAAVMRRGASRPEESREVRQPP